jgi:hypothetical protein
VLLISWNRCAEPPIDPEVVLISWSCCPKAPIDQESRDAADQLELLRGDVDRSVGADPAFNAEASAEANEMELFSLGGMALCFFSRNQKGLIIKCKCTSLPTFFWIGGAILTIHPHKHILIV